LGVFGGRVSKTQELGLSTSSKNQPERVWQALDVIIQPEAREAVEYALMEAGALGTELRDDSTITAYFDELPDREKIRDEVFDALNIYSLPTSSVIEITVREIVDRDWLAEWKKSWQPVPVGEKFLVAPPWVDIPASETRIVIRIEPGMAFGTGTHETTRLCLEAIEKHFHGKTFLDVGTGTGILAIAAAKLLPDSHVDACDTDPEAVEIARENASLNGVAQRIEFYEGTVTQVSASADCVCANLTTETIVGLLPSLVGATCGKLICSGILATQLELVVDALHKQGITTPSEITHAGEWACVVV
jgi:ribosomal protein L11 methyltransferase